MDQQRRAREPSHQAAGAGDESAERQHRVRLAAEQHAERLHHGIDKSERKLQPAIPALAPHALDVQPLHLDGQPRGRHRVRLQSAARAEPHHLHALFEQPARHGEPGEHMPAGAARHDQDATHL